MGHLSHNWFTESGLTSLIEAIQHVWRRYPLWMRAEYNDVKDPEAFQQQLRARFQVCTLDAACTPWYCNNGCKVHVPYFVTSSNPIDEPKAAVEDTSAVRSTPESNDAPTTD